MKEGIRVALATSVEQAIAIWIIDQLQVTVNLYLGTENTKGEVITRGIGLYEKNTFRTLLGYHAYELLRQRDVELQKWGRIHLSDKEITSILEQVNVAINGWIKTWVAFTKANPDIRISNITGKRSKVLLWINMSEKTWKEVKATVDAYMVELRVKYHGYSIYPFFYDNRKEELEALWPNLKFVSAEDIKNEILNYLEGKLSSDTNPSMISCYVAHAVDNLSEVADHTIEDSEIKSKHKDIIKQKKQDFIDYVTQQVFGDKGYFYGSLRENVPSAISQGTQPSVTDFSNFMLARGTTEAYKNLHFLDNKGNMYNRSDLEEVIDINKQFINDAVIPEYLRRIIEKRLPITYDSTGTAFGYNIPDQETIGQIDSALAEKVGNIVDNIDKSTYDTFSPEDLADWYRALQDYSGEVADDNDIDFSFIEPITEADINAVTILTSKVVYTDPVNNATNDIVPVSTYKNKTPVVRDSRRITDWKRYYPSNVTDTERITGFKRYYPGVNDNSQLYEGRVAGWKRYYPGFDSDIMYYVGRVAGWKRYYPGVNDDSQLKKNRVTNWQRFYPYKARESKRISDWKRYYPSNTSTDTRVANWDRYYPGEGQIASDFLPTYRTFSGHDMVVTVQVPISDIISITKVIGAFQTISYSIHNEKHPIRVLGDMNVKRYVFGPRMIAGSIVLTVFDRHWMRELMGTYVQIKSETERYFLMDELPSMNITISCANEYGYNAKLALYGVTIVNEGQIMSINDVYTENTYEFFALNIDYLDRVESTLAKQKNNRLRNIPVENLDPPVVPNNKDDRDNSDKDDNSEPVPSLIPPTKTEEVESLEDPDEIDQPPEVIEGYGKDDAKYDKEFADIIEEIEEKGDKAVLSDMKRWWKRVQELEQFEKDDRIKKWEDEILKPKRAQLLSKYGLTEEDMDDDTLRRKLGDNYDHFINVLNAYGDSYDHMMQLIEQEVFDKWQEYIKTYYEPYILQREERVPFPYSGKNGNFTEVKNVQVENTDEGNTGYYNKDTVPSSGDNYEPSTLPGDYPDGDPSIISGGGDESTLPSGGNPSVISGGDNNGESPTLPGGYDDGLITIVGGGT